VNSIKNVSNLKKNENKAISVSNKNSVINNVDDKLSKIESDEKKIESNDKILEYDTDNIKNKFNNNNNNTNAITENKFFSLLKSPIQNKLDFNNSNNNNDQVAATKVSVVDLLFDKEIISKKNDIKKNNSKNKNKKSGVVEKAKNKIKKLSTSETKMHEKVQKLLKSANEDDFVTVEVNE
jgi:hypothetical protein